MPIPQAPVAVPPLTWRDAITTFKRELIERTLQRTHGNRTRAAEALGLQRTYLLRLMREMDMRAPYSVRRDAHLGATDVAVRRTVLNGPRRQA